jgi:hypothetical protein
MMGGVVAARPGTAPDEAPKNESPLRRCTGGGEIRRFAQPLRGAQVTTTTTRRATSELRRAVERLNMLVGKKSAKDAGVKTPADA